MRADTYIIKIHGVKRMGYTTVLSYQMMIEEKLYAAMINGEQRNNFFVAVGYAEALTVFLEMDKDALPPRPIPDGNATKAQHGLEKYYFLLLNSIITTESEIIKRVRVKYNKDSTDIPKGGKM